MAARIEKVVGGTKIDDILLRDFTSDRMEGFVRVFPEGYGPGRTGNGYLIPQYMYDNEKRIREFEIRSDDVWVASYPKTGTTWTQEMVWCIGNDLDYERAKSTHLGARFPFLEMVGVIKPVDMSQFGPPNMENAPLIEFLKDSITFTEKMESPRYIKTHLPWDLLPEQIKSKKSKIIYVSRNPKDTCISYYHHARVTMGYRGNFEDFAELFLRDTLPYDPFWDHLLSYWEHREDSNVLFIKYEDMIKNLPSVIRKVTSFMDKKQLNDEDMKKLCDHLSFKAMKSNSSLNYEDLFQIRRMMTGLSFKDDHFMRKGKANAWKEELSPELVERFDEWTKKHLNGTQLSFD